MADGNNTATIKFGGGFEAPWLVLSGDVETMRSDLIEAFGWDASNVSSLNLPELMTRASVEAQGVFAASSGLGGVPTSSTRGNRGGGRKASQKPSEAPQSDEQVKAGETSGDDSPSPQEAAEAALKGCESKQDLQKAFLRHKEAISNSDELKKLYNETKTRVVGK